jgi:hypothetical protein
VYNVSVVLYFRSFRWWTLNRHRCLLLVKVNVSTIYSMDWVALAIAIVQRWVILRKRVPVITNQAIWNAIPLAFSHICTMFARVYYSLDITVVLSVVVVRCVTKAWLAQSDRTSTRLADSLICNFHFLCNAFEWGSIIAAPASTLCIRHCRNYLPTWSICTTTMLCCWV